MSQYRLQMEIVIEADGLPMAEDLGAKLVEHLSLPVWVDEMKLVAVEDDGPDG